MFSVRWNGKYFNGWNYYLDILQIQENWVGWNFITNECACDLTKCVVCKKTLTWSPQKRSRPALTYHELLSNFITPLDLDNSARICSAWRIALTSSKSKISAETFVDASKHFQFCLFWNGKGREILKKKHSKFQRVGSKCAKADVQFSSELIYVLQFSQHFKATKLRAHET